MSAISTSTGVGKLLYLFSRAFIRFFDFEIMSILCSRYLRMDSSFLADSYLTMTTLMK